MYAWVPESFVEQERRKIAFLFPSSYVAAVSEYMKTQYKCLPTYLADLSKENNFCQVKVRSSDFRAGKVPKKNSGTHTGFAVCKRNDNSRKSSPEVETRDLNGILISINSLFMTFGSVRRFRWLQEVISMRFRFKVLWNLFFYSSVQFLRFYTAGGRITCQANSNSAGILVGDKHRYTMYSRRSLRCTTFRHGMPLTKHNLPWSSDTQSMQTRNPKIKSVRICVCGKCFRSVCKVGD